MAEEKWVSLGLFHPELNGSYFTLLITGDQANLVDSTEIPLRHWLKERPKVLFAAPTLASEDLPSTIFVRKLWNVP